MLLSFDEILTFTVKGEDGLLGNLTDVLFSDDTWAVRYLVVAPSGSSESDEEPILVSPMALGDIDRRKKDVEVRLSSDRVKNAPRLDSHKPVSRHWESRYYDYFGWPYYWAGGAVWGPFLSPGELARTEVSIISKADGDAKPPKHPHLRSAEEVTSYRLEGGDGRKLGPIEDLVIEDDSYRVKYMAVRTRKWFPGGKRVLVPTELIEGVSWAERKIAAKVPTETVKTAPSLDDSEPIVRLDEEPVLSHYATPPGSDPPS